MADLNDAEVNLFNDQRARPLSELIRNVAILIEDHAAVYTSEIVPKLAAMANGDTILGGRTGEGVDDLTKGDLVAFIAVAAAVKAAFDADPDAVRKLTVRAPNVT